MTDQTPDPGANHTLPALNPLKARSTVAAVLAIVSLLAPALVDGVDQDGLLNNVERAVLAGNELVGLAALAWFWIERRAPNFRLSFKGR